MSFNKIALLLPGQGAQHVGMGKDLADSERSIGELYAAADEILGLALSRLCWQGPEAELTSTENAQPAILLHSYAVWTLLPPEVRSRTVVAAGHSLGEFTAYLIAGTLGFADALRLVRRRGELMAATGGERPGTMAAIIGLETDAAEAVCASVRSGTVVAANYNAPGQLVISGDEAAVAEASAAALEAGARRALPLNVSGAFHSPLMETAREGLRAVLDEVDLSDPAFPVVANATAEPVHTAAHARDLLIRQLTSPVRWVESVESMRSLGPNGWLEIGPGRVLSGLLRRIDREQTVLAAGDAAGLQECMEVLGNA